jgi:primosomal protein N' (replication factor Y)
VTLVGVISADVGLGVADFRASERTFQLLTQVAGRAGRGEHAGEAIIQTLYPDHYSVQLACRQDYPAFYERELKFRRAMRYPPLVSVINAVVRSRTFAGAMKDAADIVERLRRREGNRGEIRVLGPAPAPLGKLRGEYRAQFLVKSPNRRGMREALIAAIADRPEFIRRTTIDVDPISVL